MRYRVVIGDVRQPLRGVIEVEAESYTITELGLLVILAGGDLAGPPHPIVTYAPGAWRSIVEVEGFRRALQPGSVSDEATKVEGPRRENPARRQAHRPA